MTHDIRLWQQERAAAILAQMREVLLPILARYPVIAAYIYGSVARGTVLPTSDVDVALVLRQSLPPYERFQLELAIEAEIEDATGLSPIDVRVINDAPIRVRGRIIRDGILVYEGDRRQRLIWQVQTYQQFLDFEPFARRIEQAFIAHLQRKYGHGES